MNASLSKRGLLGLAIILAALLPEANAQVSAEKTPATFAAQVNSSSLTSVFYEFTYWTPDFGWMPPKQTKVTKTLQYLPVLRGSALLFIPFHLIREATPSAVTLEDGTVIRASLHGGPEDSNLFWGNDRRIKGQTSLSDVAYPIEKVRSITFGPRDTKAEAASEPQFGSRSQVRATLYPTIGEEIEVSGFSIVGTMGSAFSFSETNELEVTIGDAEAKINVSKIAAIKDMKLIDEKSQYGTHREVTAKLSSRTGEVVDVKLVYPFRTHFAGWTPWGWVIVAAPRTKAIELH